MLEIKNTKSFYISTYNKEYKDQVIDLIFSIWNDEHKFSVSYESKPDLFAIESFYSGLKGKFFLGVAANEEVVGTIAIENLNSENFALKRMFVKKEFRRQGVAQELFNKIIDWAKSNGAKTIYLSTHSEKSAAAVKFYRKNNFKEIDKEQVPPNFPIFKDDDVFMRLSLSSN